MKKAQVLLYVGVVCCMSLCFAQAQSPVVSITSAELRDKLSLSYEIKNRSEKDIYVFSAFLTDPFSGEFDKNRGTEVVWTTFTPEFKGNYFTKLEFIKILAGGTYSGHLTSVYAAQQINNCTKSKTVPLRLAIGWGNSIEDAQLQWSRDKSTTITIVEKWQAVVLSEGEITERTTAPNPKQCPPREDIEIWR
jgi:hypothetical protein